MKHLKHIIWKVLPALIILCTWFVPLVPVPARAAPVWPDPLVHPDLSHSAAIEAFWDTFFSREMGALGVYGAVMVIIKDGEFLFAKGYGYADAASGTPMDPSRTILRAGSIVKTVTATAVTQLAEQGKLDLDADINNYLDLFKVPGTFPEPVTARHLINMTGGFDTRSVGIRVSSAEEVKPLGQYLAERMPPRVLPPGRYRRYNDHEVALAGYLVEVVSGMSYEQYVRQHIFEPLEMTSSSILLPGDQISRLARGYPVGRGPESAYPLSYYYLNDAPGAGFNTTATDVGHYMIAHLQNGLYTRRDGTDVRILADETARHMHQTAFAYHPSQPGQANTFDEKFYDGQRYLRKQGGAPGMQNDMLLLLDQGTGFYLFSNSEGTALRNDWEAQVLKMYLSTFEPPLEQLEPLPNAGERGSDYAGIYQQISDNTSETTIVQVQALVDPDLWASVGANADGSLDIWGRRYVEVEPGVFQDPAAGGLLSFEIGDQGKANFLFDERTAYRRQALMETPSLQLGLLGFAILVFLSGLILLGFGLFRENVSARLLPGVVSALNLIFLVGLAALLMPVATGGDLWQFSFEPSIQLRLVLGIPVITALLAAGLLVETVAAWRQGRYDLTARLHNSLVLIAVVAFLYFLNTWNLLGWRF
ncbi:MAG TPA: serine hydrolase [Anaerolineales bacterium]|jgi:CubicO group peptidase (beta-lactamase class C family)|nr:serine hydrolase [Anaerolineales bacterium]